MKDDKLYLIYISERIERIESYVGEIDKELPALKKSIRKMLD
jgi:uncharacterized protein with HEPN domain